MNATVSRHMGATLSRLRLSAPSWYAWRVWRRNQKNSLQHWHTSVVPPLLEPILYLVAFGAGVGYLISGFEYGGEEVRYVTYIAPALVVIAAMYHSFFETTYSSFVRMYYQKIWDAMTAMPLSLGDILVGEILWGATMGTMAGLIVLAIVVIFGLVELAAIWVIVLGVLITASLFSVIGLLFTAILPNIEAFNYPTFLFVFPMFLFGETFFPVSVLPDWVVNVASFTPLYNLMSVIRPAAYANVALTDLWRFLPWVVVIPPLIFAIHWFMARRLID